QNGYGVNQDYAEAVKWFRKSAEQGNANGQSNLEAMYYIGKGVIKDRKEAVKYFRLAAQQGNKNAQKNLKILSETW
ncbi:MAG: sel1 repeat family protein, partial [Runella slithyformis]